jgi:hypothetical protein
MSGCLSVSLHNSAPYWWIFMKFDIWGLLENLSRNCKFHYNPTGIMNTLYEDLFILTVTPRWILRRMRNVSHKSYRDKTHILRSVTSYRNSCRFWNVEKYWTDRKAIDDNIIGPMPFVCWIAKATDTRSEYAILIAFSWQQWLRERASMLRDTHPLSRLVIYLFS